MRSTLVALALTAGLATGGAALVAPGAFAAAAADSAGSSATSTATPSPSATDRAAARLTALEDALKGLVTDGTLTQTQADEVASTLSTSDALRGPGGGRHGDGAGHLAPEAVAKVLGVTVDELRTQEQAGKTLTQIAATKGISKADLVTKLVAAAKAQLAADVEAGTLTQTRADAVAEDLTARTTTRVDQVHQGRGHHGGPAAAPTA